MDKAIQEIVKTWLGCAFLEKYKEIGERQAAELRRKFGLKNDKGNKRETGLVSCL